MAGYAAVFGLAVTARVVMMLLPVAYISPAQQAVWSWHFFAVFALSFVVAVALATSTRLPAPTETIARARHAFGIPLTVGVAVALLTIWSDVVDPVARSRGVASVHVHGWAAVPFYAYGAVLLTTVFHFLPMAVAARLAERSDRKWRFALLCLGVAFVGLTEDAGYFFRADLSLSVEAARHVLSVLANCTEALFIYRFGFLAGLAQRGSTYLLWHLVWPWLAFPL